MKYIHIVPSYNHKIKVTKQEDQNFTIDESYMSCHGIPNLNWIMLMSVVGSPKMFNKKEN